MVAVAGPTPLSSDRVFTALIIVAVVTFSLISLKAFWVVDLTSAAALLEMSCCNLGRNFPRALSVQLPSVKSAYSLHSINFSNSFLVMNGDARVRTAFGSSFKRHESNRTSSPADFERCVSILAARAVS